MSKLIEFTKENIKDITSGYYWLRNTGFDKSGLDTILHRPVEIVVVREAYARWAAGFRDGIWMTVGIYVILVGNDQWHGIDYVLDWGNVALTPANPPKGF